MARAISTSAATSPWPEMWLPTTLPNGTGTVGRRWAREWTDGWRRWRCRAATCMREAGSRMSARGVGRQRRTTFRTGPPFTHLQLYNEKTAPRSQAQRARLGIQPSNRRGPLHSSALALRPRAYSAVTIRFNHGGPTAGNSAPPRFPRARPPSAQFLPAPAPGSAGAAGAPTS